MSRRSTHFNVAPRYSPGSPAQVDEEIALAVAEDERRGYEQALKGRNGEADRVRALQLGLTGIVEERTEGRKSWTVRDLITGETCERPFTQNNFRSRK